MTVDLGRRYHDPQTGITGTAVARTEHQHGCARVLIEYVDGGRRVEEVAFDEPRLYDAETGRPADLDAGPGGPKPSPARRAR